MRRSSIAAGTKADRLRIVQRIQALTGNPQPQGSEKLAGYADRYRIRQGKHRIIYLIDDEHREVTIFGSDIGKMCIDKPSNERSKMAARYPAE
ncbi:MAG: type II toxin-antitoxin system RelE family toxin [Candidatus Binatia bacterium]